jgi:hypothetical protein
MKEFSVKDFLWTVLVTIESETTEHLYVINAQGVRDKIDNNEDAILTYLGA